MIPAWLDLRLLAAFTLGALAAYGPAACVGRSQANAANAAKIEAASAKVVAAANEAERAANLAEMVRSAKTQTEIQELREVVNETESDSGVGPATGALLDRLRKRNSR